MPDSDRHAWIEALARADLPDRRFTWLRRAGGRTVLLASELAATREMLLEWDEALSDPDARDRFVRDAWRDWSRLVFTPRARAAGDDHDLEQELTDAPKEVVEVGTELIAGVREHRHEIAELLAERFGLRQIVVEPGQTEFSGDRRDLELDEYESTDEEQLHMLVAEPPSAPGYTYETASGESEILKPAKVRVYRCPGLGPEAVERLSRERAARRREAEAAAAAETEAETEAEADDEAEPESEEKLKETAGRSVKASKRSPARRRRRKSPAPKEDVDDPVRELEDTDAARDGPPDVASARRHLETALQASEEHRRSSTERGKCHRLLKLLSAMEREAWFQQPPQTCRAAKPIVDEWTRRWNEELLHPLQDLKTAIQKQEDTITRRLMEHRLDLVRAIVRKLRTSMGLRQMAVNQKDQFDESLHIRAGWAEVEKEQLEGLVAKELEPGWECRFSDGSVPVRKARVRVFLARPPGQRAPEAGG